MANQRNIKSETRTHQTHWYRFAGHNCLFLASETMDSNDGHQKAEKYFFREMSNRNAAGVTNEGTMWGAGRGGVHKHLIFFLKCSKLKIFWRRRELIVRFFVSWFREIFIKMYVCRYDTVGPTQEDQQMRNLQRTEFVKQIRQKQKNNANRQDTVRCLQKKPNYSASFWTNVVSFYTIR